MHMLRRANGCSKADQSGDKHAKKGALRTQDTQDEADLEM